MKKLIFVLLAMMLLLSGCVEQGEAYSELSLHSLINDALEAEVPDAIYNNATKEYYSYYLPRGVGREDRDELSNLFNIYGNKAILNIDVASIIAEAYYEGEDEYGKKLRNLDTFSQTEFVTHGKYTNSSGKEVMYRIYVSTVDEEKDYIVLQDNHFLFAATCYKTQTMDMAYEMIKILKTCAIDEEKIVSVYSNVTETVRKTSIISLFKEILPESGYVADYIDDWKNDPEFVIIDNSSKEEEDPANIIDTQPHNQDDNSFTDPDSDNNENR